jgi:hypothetical protein
MCISSLVRRWLLFLSAFSLSVLPALAREKSDVIVLKNGNIINGEIRRLHRGLLTVKTDAMGTPDIKWEDVKRVSSKFTFVVEDSSGSRYVGTLQAADEPQRLNVVGLNPASNLHHLFIVEMSEVGAGLWNRFSGSIDFGYTFAKASDRTQLDVASEIIYRTRRYEGQFAYDALFSRSNGEQDIDRRVISLGGSVYFRKKWRLLAKGMWEHNLELQLDKRASLMVAPAYDILQTNRSSVLLFGGMATSHELYYNEPSRNNAEGAFGINAQIFKLYSPKMDISAGYMILPNFTTSGRVRMELDSKLRFEIFRDFFLSFNFYDSYDNKPPSQTATRNDYGFVTGISWSFHK